MGSTGITNVHNPDGNTAGTVRPEASDENGDPTEFARVYWNISLSIWPLISCWIVEGGAAGRRCHRHGTPSGRRQWVYCGRPDGVLTCRFVDRAGCGRRRR